MTRWFKSCSGVNWFNGFLDKRDLRQPGERPEHYNRWSRPVKKSKHDCFWKDSSWQFLGLRTVEPVLHPAPLHARSCENPASPLRLLGRRRGWGHWQGVTWDPLDWYQQSPRGSHWAALHGARSTGGGTRTGYSMLTSTWRVTSRVFGWKPEVAASVWCLANPWVALSTMPDMITLVTECKNRNFQGNYFSCARKEKVLVIRKHSH